MKRRLVWLLDEYVNHRLLRHRWEWICGRNESQLHKPVPSALSAEMRRRIAAGEVPTFKPRSEDLLPFKMPDRDR